MSEVAAGELRRTPLHEIHQRLGARLVPFAGYEMPVQYTSIIEEHRTVRSAVGLFDLSHMGEIEVTGEEAVAFLRHALASDPGDARDRPGAILDGLQRGRRDRRRPHRLPARERRLPGGLQRGQPRGGGGAAHQPARTGRLRRVDRRPQRPGRAGGAPGAERGGAGRRADRPRPGRHRQLPLSAGHRRRRRVPGGAHRLHRRGRLRALLRRPPRAGAVGGADRRGRASRPATVRPGSARHASPRGRHAALRQRARPRDESRSRSTWAGS